MIEMLVFWDTGLGWSRCRGMMVPVISYPIVGPGWLPGENKWLRLKRGGQKG
jgi:hypothetical protein